jgi:hypothetical protein
MKLITSPLKWVVQINKLSYVLKILYHEHTFKNDFTIFSPYQGYIRHARKREDMFSEDRISVIFGNMEDIYEFSQKFLGSIEDSFVIDNPHQSQLGHCFLECVSN